MRDIVKYFMELASIDSESKDERRIADRLKQDLVELGAEVIEDDIHLQTGGNTGNIYAYFKGQVAKKPILFCSHIDTVKPGKNVRPILDGDRIVSDGNSVLGADDKSGVAEILFGISQVIESGRSHAPIEVLFTVSEEIGLLGAKYFDKSKLKSALGFALDTQDVGDVVIGAPAQNSIVIKITGVEAHAGVQPEKGINAIRVASEAIAAMPIGRIDFETTSNVGIINGGIATNIVPGFVQINGEARSHAPQKLDQVCKDITSAVEHAVQKYQSDFGKAAYDIQMHREYDSFYVSEEEVPVMLAKNAMLKLGIEPNIHRGGGGSDANIINAAGVPVIILGTGMHSYHTVHEYIETKDLIKGAEIVAEMITQYSITEDLA